MRTNTTTGENADGIALDSRHFDLEATVCANGKINVRNSTSGSGDVHTVHIDDGGAVDRCTCKGHTYAGRCYHADAIAANDRLRAVARAVSKGAGADADRFRLPEDPKHVSEGEARRDTRGVVDAYADRVAARAAVDDTPL